MLAGTTLKSPNGQAKGTSYLLEFQIKNDAEKKAWELAQQLASQRKLKQVLISVLVAIHTVQERTGQKLDLSEFLASFVISLVMGGTSSPFNGTKIAPTMTVADLPVPFAGTLDHANPSEARKEFAAGMGDLFADDEDLWG